MPLDREAYPSRLLGSEPIAWPPWACKAPDGGVHISNTAGRIDVDLAQPPHSRVEFHWTHNFGVSLIADSWLDDIRDLFEDNRVFLGDVRKAGEKIRGWSTIHEPGPPVLLASEGIAKTCPICGDYYTTLWGRLSIGDQRAADRLLFVNREGIFIREDLARSRDLRRPTGAFSPSIIKLKPDNKRQ